MNARRTFFCRAGSPNPALKRELSHEGGGIRRSHPALLCFLCFFWPALFGLRLSAQTVPLDPLVISATRAPVTTAEIPFTTTVLGGETLRTTPALTLDDALRSIPGFGLFRRSGSLSAHPTAQGVSLRGLGPSGASRSLVLLDGVPLNDPFGGWIAWTKVPRESLTSVEVLRGGGATAWGNAALGGVVQLLTENVGPALAPGPRSADERRPYKTSGRFNAGYGAFDTRAGEFSLTQSYASGALQFSGKAFATDGFALVAPEDRGPLDQPASSRHSWLSGRWMHRIDAQNEIAFSARTYRERRNNGTPYQQNSSDENAASVSFTSHPSATFSWQAVAYGQDQSFASTFSSVNATRTAETPASNQYDVPATAFGAAWTGAWQHNGNAHTSAGIDHRSVRGETREYFTFASGDFTRERTAGGTQEITGLFVLHQHRLSTRFHATLGARVDFWRDHSGHRRETTRATGAVLRNDSYPTQDDVEFSPNAGFVWQPADGWRVRASAQQAFRRPTLNELYRPFRVGNVITEANAALRTERVTSAEIGADYTHGRLNLGATLFRNELRDAVGNVTLYRGPGTFPIVGFVPAGGLGRQRLNLERTRVQGVELTARWQAAESVSVDASYLYNDATVTRAVAAPALVGKRLAQVPRQTAMLGLSWRPTKTFTLTPRLRAFSRQFEDDENQLILGAAAVIDLGLSWRVTPACELYLNAENLADARIETGRSADGIVNTGTPRLVFGGVRCSW